MPPNKAGARVATKTILPAQKALEFKVVKNAKGKGRKGRPPKTLEELKKNNEGFLKLRIPLHICKMFPSVRKFNGTKKNKMKDFVFREEAEEDKKPPPQTLLGVKRKRGEQQKYHLKLVAEENLNAMIWDVLFAKNGQVLVTTSDGAFISNDMLANIDKMGNVILGGGMCTMSDGKIVILCRFMDCVNVFTADGSFLKSFKAGFSPQSIVANKSDELLVTDTGNKEIRIYALSGKHLRTIKTKGDGYEFMWPLYMTITSTNHLLVSDCHLQKVLHFDQDEKFVSEFPMKTYGGNQVLRPHGLCTNDDDVFVIDRAIDSMEVFLEDGTFLQTLMPSEEGVNIKPKICRTSQDGQYLIIGGLTGQVMLYKFVSEPHIKEELEVTLQIKKELLTKPGRPVKVKRELLTKVKQENVKKPKIESQSKEDIIILD